MMKRGNTEAETLKLNGWGVGDILQGEEYGRIRHVLITAVGEERFLCRWGLNGDFGSEDGTTTLSMREWKKVGVRGGEMSRPKYKNTKRQEAQKQG